MAAIKISMVMNIYVCVRVYMCARALRLICDVYSLATQPKLKNCQTHIHSTLQSTAKVSDLITAGASTNYF